MALSVSNASLSACDMCGLEQGLVVCPCRYPAALVCVGCFDWHCRLEERNSHAVFPFQLRELVKDRRNFDQIVPRIRKAQSTKEWLLAQIREMELAGKQLEEVLSDVSVAVETWKQGLRKRFAELEEQLLAYFETAINMLDESITALTPAQLSFIENIDVKNTPPMLTTNRSQPINIAEVLDSLVNFQLNLPQFIAPSQPSISTTSPNPPELSLSLPLLSTKFLRLVSLPSFQTTTCAVLNSILDIDEKSVWTLLDRKSLFMCGGQATGKRAALYSLSAQFLTRLSDMRFSRFMHCLACFEGLVYVFGGAGEAAQSAEKFALDEDRWFPLPPPLMPKIGASVCLNGRQIYLFGGATSKSIEQFHIDTEEFSLLESELPVKAWTIALPLGPEIYLLQKDKAILLDLRNLCVMKKWRIPAGNWWSPTAAVAVNGSFTFLQYSGAVWTFSPLSISLTKQPILV